MVERIREALFSSVLPMSPPPGEQEKHTVQTPPLRQLVRSDAPQNGWPGRTSCVPGKSSKQEHADFATATKNLRESAPPAPANAIATCRKKKKKYREKQLRQQDKELESLCSPCCRQLRRFALFYFSFGQRSRSESTLFLFAISFSPVSAAKISESPGAALSCVVERTARPRERALADACQGLGGGGGPSSANNQNRLGPAV